MDSLRIHTFYLDIRGIKKLKLENVYDFIADKLLLTEADVAAIQPDLAESKVYVECHSLEKAEEVVRRFDGSQELVNNGEVHKIKLQMEDGATEVKIYHLPPRMPNEEITRFMESYGEILSIRNETCKSKRFANTPNGVRMVRIRLRKQIPSFISVKGYSTYVTYSNQIQTCKHCGDCVHYGTSCGEIRVNKAATGRAQISYADIASAGDCNAVTDAVDSTGSSNMSAALKRLTSGLDLVDSWKHMNHTVVDYTFVRGRSMSRIDKIYVSKSQARNIRSATIQANCFSDHKAVITRVVLPASSRLCSRPIWRLNNTLLTDENMLELSQKWAYWKRFKQNYDSWLEWWVLFVKEKLARFFKWKQGIVTRRFQATMGFQYACLKRAYQQHLATDCTTEINRIKAVMLQTRKQFSTSRRPRNERFFCGENVSIFQLEEDLRRRSETTIRQMQHEGQQLTEPAQIVEHVQQHFGRLFAREEIDQHTNFVPERRITNSRINDQLMDEIGEQEILAAIRASAPNKSPGSDGHTREFFF
ncbi:hypothetical protein pipiens_016785 [Culex pipiens pipiens]|uniref:RRM domain-containing protein n=1 Tax=Culex pipiens pipiens TaxID=38569 RepID=A0ABD1CK27_CULPP